MQKNRAGETRFADYHCLTGNKNIASIEKADIDAHVHIKFGYQYAYSIKMFIGKALH